VYPPRLKALVTKSIAAGKAKKDLPPSTAATRRWDRPPAREQTGQPRNEQRCKLVRRLGIEPRTRFASHVAAVGAGAISTTVATAVASVLSQRFAHKSERRFRGSGRRSWSR
jgi:hypothetical protein